MGSQCGGTFEVVYEVPGHGEVVEATVTKCGNGLAVNYAEPSMRRRDPDCLVIGDEKPTDKISFAEPSWFLRVEEQLEVGLDGYDRGAAVLTDFFRGELHKFLHPELDALGKRIIDCCLEGGTVADYEAFLPSVDLAK